MPVNQEVILDFISHCQQADGQFLSYESYPDGHPLHDRGWHTKAPSPFVHANILIALSSSEHPKAKAIIQRGLPFIRNSMERNGFWRFWPHGGQTHNVPLDLDDTAVCSFLLEQNGQSIRNQHLLLRNTGPGGRLLTWVVPRTTYLRYPLFWTWLRRDARHCQTTIQSPMLDVSDSEPAVLANILLYVGDHPKARPTVACVLDQLAHPEEMELQYYADPIVPYYHASRALHFGTRSLEPLAQWVPPLFREGRIPIADNPLSQSMAVTTLHYLGAADQLPSFGWHQQWLNMEGPRSDWPAYPYFVSKDHNFRAGAPALTAAFYLEAIGSMTTL
jgi:hypothetical protein